MGKLVIVHKTVSSLVLISWVSLWLLRRKTSRRRRKFENACYKLCRLFVWAAQEWIPKFLDVLIEIFVWFYQCKVCSPSSRPIAPQIIFLLHEWYLRVVAPNSSGKQEEFKKDYLNVLISKITIFFLSFFPAYSWEI